jgi:hypothetical protein
MSIWYAGADAPVRPIRKEEVSDAAYARALEHYADNIERMLVWLLQNYAQFPNRIKAEMDRIKLEHARPAPGVSP